MRRTPLKIIAGVTLAGCVHQGPLDRDLHRVDGELVSSRAPSPRAYEAYVQARYALELDPPDLDRAAQLIDQALRYDPFDPQLWTTPAEIYAARGDDAEARRSADEALELRPGYEPAQAVLDELSSPDAPETEVDV